MGDFRSDNHEANAAAPVVSVKPAVSKPKPAQPWLWNVVLIDDEEHSFDYVIGMMQRLFGYSADEAASFAETVDRVGRGVCMTTHKEHAELKCEQVLGFGKDPATAVSKGPMGCILEPAEPAAV